MKAIVIEQFGGVEMLQLKEVLKPEPQHGEILVKVKAAGVNPVDFKIRKGLLQTRMPHEFPIILGWDLAGIVEEVGEEVHEFKKGDAVYGYARKEMIRDGSYAEYLVLEPKHLAIKPKNISFEEAAAIPLAALTAYQSLFESLKLKEAEVILIHAGAGGVGSFAIQMAKNVGAKVITTASASKHSYLKKLGTDHCIDYQNQSFVEEVLRLYPLGVDAVFDTMGGEIQRQSVEVLKRGGRLTSILALEESVLAHPEIQSGYVFVRPEELQLDLICEMIEEKKMKVHVSEVFPLAQAAKAHQRIESGHVTGKLVLKI
ncbi:MAG: NADP-dependent oxidoreductase [Deltaproteobacteria bacterium]|nr:NADP-dependent oxidoreductase [Deltaproteobacteria bacterium]